MNCPTTPFTQALDQVIGEFESGQMRQGVLLLAGFLDAAVSNRTHIEPLRRALARHPLRAFLSAAGPAGWSDCAIGAELAELAQCSPPAVESRCGAEVASTVYGLGFARALQDRRKLGTAAIIKAWRRGDRIALIDSGGLRELAPLAGMELGNLAFAHADPAVATALRARFNLGGITQRDQFELILASGAADERSEASLSQWLTDQAHHLAPGGTLLLSSFTPGHLGFGWQTICLARDFCCHDSAALERCARASGLTIRSMINAAGSLVWAELAWPQDHEKQCSPTQIRGES